MGLVEVVPQHKIRMQWSLRGKVEVSSIQLVGQNALGLPYIQGQIRNRFDRLLQLQIVARVYSEGHAPIFIGSPGILEVLELRALQQRTFRISLHDVDRAQSLDRQLLWATRSRIELTIAS